MDRDKQAAKELVRNFTFKQKLTHFWYYYGKYTIAAIFAVAFVVFTVVECVMQVNYDLNIAYYSSHAVDKEAVAELADSLEPLINDISDNDVKDVLITVNEADITKEEHNEVIEAILTKIPVELAADEFQMYILDENYLEFFNRAFEGVVQSTVLLSDIPEVSKALGFQEGEKVYLVMTVEFEQSKGNEIKAAERENAALVMEYFNNMLK